MDYACLQLHLKQLCNLLTVNVIIYSEYSLLKRTVERCPFRIIITHGTPKIQSKANYYPFIVVLKATSRMKHG
jgi:hypothetical protein